MSSLSQILRALFHESTGYVHLVAIKRGETEDSRPANARVRLAGVEKFIKLWLSTSCLYFGVAARRTEDNGKLENCASLSALFSEIDFKDYDNEQAAIEKLQSFPVAPSIAVRSGGGLHCYWLLDAPLDLQADADRARMLLRALARATGGDLHAAEPARILRLPGTKNFKYDPPRDVVIESFSEQRYPLTDIERHLTLDDASRSWQPADLANLLGQHWPSGSRHEAAKAVGGFLASRQVSLDDAIRIMGDVTTIARDEETKDRLKAVRDSYSAFIADKKTTGLPTIKKFLGEEVAKRLAEWFPRRKEKATATGRLSHEDFVAFLPQAAYLMIASGNKWAASSITTHVKSPDPKLSICEWLDRHRYVDELTWAPGREQFLKDTLVVSTGEIHREGMFTLNLYQPPRPLQGGDPKQAVLWLDHLRRLYPNEWEHIVGWLAWRIQHPEVKINHGLVLGGSTRIGKDSILVPVREAVGEWNFVDASPEQLMGRFNGFLKAVILRVNELRDLGDVNRYQLYERCKWYLASPPEFFRVDEKNLREHPVWNVVGIIFTTNFKEGGLYLPPDDARHFVAWSECLKEEFFEEGEDTEGLPRYFKRLYDWYTNGGIEHVVAYLREPERLKTFDPKAPPPRTDAWHQIVAANRSPEEAEIADLLDKLQRPEAVTIDDLIEQALDGSDQSLVAFASYLTDRKNRRSIPHRLETVGYTAVRNPSDKHDGQWKVGGRRVSIYVKNSLPAASRWAAARERAEKTDFRLTPKLEGKL